MIELQGAKMSRTCKGILAGVYEGAAQEPIGRLTWFETGGLGWSPYMDKALLKAQQELFLLGLFKFTSADDPELPSKPNDRVYEFVGIMQDLEALLRPRDLFRGRRSYVIFGQTDGYFSNLCGSYQNVLIERFLQNLSLRDIAKSRAISLCEVKKLIDSAFESLVDEGRKWDQAQVKGAVKID